MARFTIDSVIANVYGPSRALERLISPVLKVQVAGLKNALHKTSSLDRLVIIFDKFRLDSFPGLKDAKSQLGDFCSETLMSNIGAFGSSMAQFASQWGRISAAIAKWLQDMPEALHQALQGSGCVLHLDMPITTLNRVVDVYEEQGAEAAVAFFRTAQEELLASDGFREALLERWKANDRWPVLEHILEAHDRGLYGVSVPAAIAQAEGIQAAQIIAENLSDGYVSQGKIETWAKNLAASDGIGGALVSELIDTWMLRFLHGNTPTGKLARHEIMHGGSYTYGTLSNSVTAILWIDYVITRIREAEVEQDT